MARIKCKSCSEWINDTDERCYSCGAVNEDYKRLMDGSPKTIEELRAWFGRETSETPINFVAIGMDVNEPGYKSIVKDGAMVYIYQNDETGERTVLYSGRDEGYAVNLMFFELQQKLTKKRDMNARAAVAVGQAAAKTKNTAVNNKEEMPESVNLTDDDDIDKNGGATLAWIAGLFVIGVIVLILIF